MKYSAYKRDGSTVYLGPIFDDCEAAHEWCNTSAQSGDWQVYEVKETVVTPPPAGFVYALPPIGA
jgi:hypothetical protein